MCRRMLFLLFVCTIVAGCSAYVDAVTPKSDTLYIRAQWVELEEYITKNFSGRRPPFKEFYYLCNAQYEQKKYSQTLRCASDLVKITEREGSGVLCYPLNVFATCDSAPQELLALVYLDLGQYDLALEHAQQAVAIANSKDLHRDFKMRALAAQGLAYAFLGNKGQAEAARKKIANFYTGYPFASSGATRLYALSRLDLALGNYGLILQSPDEDWGSALAKGFGGTDVYFVYDLQKLFAKAKALYMTGNTARAKQEYLKLLKIPQFAQNGYLHWNILYDLGRLAHASDHLDEATDDQRQAIAIIEAQRASINSEAAKIGFVGDKQGVYGELISLLLEQGRSSEALEYVERGKSRALVDLLAERQGIVFRGQNVQADAEQTLKQLASLEEKYTTAVSGEQGKLRNVMTDLKIELRQKAPELASLVTVSAPKAAEIQAQLCADETLLEFYGQGGALYAFTVTRDNIKAVKLDGNGLETDVRSLREALREVRSEAWKPLANKLHARLIAPVAADLTNPKLIIVSHGALHYLPWSALTDGKQFLVDKSSIQLLPSASVLQFLASRKPATAKDMLLLGNPDLGDKTMDLPGAEAEAKAIKSIWPNSTMLMRKAATKAALTKAGQLFKVIHLAAHGEFVSDRPLASRILLAPDGSDNGQLTAGDLYEMQFSADLVTLSACETGMGKVLSGDDVGLSP